MSVQGPSGQTPVTLQTNFATDQTTGSGSRPFVDISQENKLAPPSSRPPATEMPPPETTGTPAGAAAALSQLTGQSMVADMYAVLALFAKIAQEQRTSAREVRHSEMAAQVKSLMSAAQEIRDAAHERMVGAMVSGVMQIAAGAVQVGGGVKASNVSTTNQAGAGAITAGFGGASTMLNAVGTITSGLMEQQASGHDAKKAELEAMAKAQDTATQQAGDLMQQMQDVIRDIREKLASIEQSLLDTNRGIARNI